VVVGTPTRAGFVRLTRVATDDLEAGAAGEEVLVDRLAAELSRRIEAWPEAWMGLFGPDAAGPRGAGAAKFDTPFRAPLDSAAVGPAFALPPDAVRAPGSPGRDAPASSTEPRS